MTYDARRAAVKRQEAWIEACQKSLCDNYSNCCGVSYLERRSRLEEQCSHQWCHGIVDVLNQAQCNTHVNMPNENTPPYTREKDQEFGDLIGFRI